jgi:hypothetical protein
MKYRRSTSWFVFVSLFAAMAMAGDQMPASPSSSTKAPKMSKQTRMELVKLVNAELVYVRAPFPMGREGLKLKDGVVTPSGAELQQMMAVWGPAAKSGDAARITDVVFKDNFIHVEINGGPIRKQKWYQHISVGGSGGSTPIAPSDPNANARGSFVNVYFDNYIPEMTGREFKELLRPVLDFESKSREEAYLETVPPKVKDAIQNHRVLVGMNHDMVVFAKGRPPKKVREHQDEAEYEEWIYGEPPQDVEFVRFIGDEVVRLEVMKVDGQKVVRTEKEVDLEPATKVAKQDEPTRPATAPTLRRPGEEKDTDDPRRSDGASPMPPRADPNPPPNQGPGSVPN